MSLFGKKRTQISARPGHESSVARAPRAGATHRVTVDLSRAMNLAAMLASSRAAQFIEIPDLLAGLYIYEWDRLAAYWPEENRGQVEVMLRDICQISPQRWNYWITTYDSQRRADEPPQGWARFRKSRKSVSQPGSPVPSATLRAVFEAAEWVSPFRDPGCATNGDGAGKKEPDESGLPVLTCECLLLCISKYIASDTGRKLLESGLDVNQLVNAVLDPKRAPLR